MAAGNGGCGRTGTSSVCSMSSTCLPGANITHPPIDFQDMRYYVAPKPKLELESLDEVDAEILRTYEKLGIPLEEQNPARRRGRGCDLRQRQRGNHRQEHAREIRRDLLVRFGGRERAP